MNNCLSTFLLATIILKAEICLLSRTRLEDASEVPDACPATPCSCTKLLTTNDMLADCSGRNLKNVPPNLPATITSLNMSNNVLPALNDDDIQLYRQLRVLDLSNNIITTLAKNSLVNAARLQELYLNSNNLSTSNISLPPSIFDNLKDLLVLKLHNNPRDQVNVARVKEYRDDIFLNLTNLLLLTIDGIPGADFGEGFSKLSSLRTFEIYNQLTSIKNSTFRTFRSVPIRNLNIKSGTFLSSLEPESFMHFRKLVVLDLSYNQGLDLTKLSTAWYGLQNSTVRDLILSRIVPVNMQTTDIVESFFNYLESSMIQRFYFDKNNIDYYLPCMSKHLKNLVHLDISYNKLTNVGGMYADLSRMRYLKSLDASHQAKRFIGMTKRDTHTKEFKPVINVNESESDKKYRVKRNSALQDNSISSCPERIPTLKSLCPDIAFNINGTYPLADKGPWCVILPPHLESVNLSASLNVDLQFLPQIVLLGGHRMRELIYQGNGLSFFTGPLIFGNPDFSIPLFIDVSNNAIECVSPDVFKWSIKRGARFDKIVFSNNNFYVQLEQDVTGSVFKYYKDLTELHLDHNGIKSLPLGIFANLTSLEVLNLSGNSLRSLEFEFNYMKQLRLLDISNNLITTLNGDAMAKVDRHIQASNMSLNLYGNPIQCSCDTLSFLTWMQTKRALMINFIKYSCMYQGNPSVSFAQLDSKILVELRFVCSTRTALWVSGSLLGLTIVAVVLSVVAYRHRWDIRYYLLRLRTGRKELIDSEVRRKPYKYDAFVIYDHRDIQWVRHELETMIGRGTEGETDKGNLLQDAEYQQQESDQARFRFCIHDRDFEAGEHINENIISSILSSRKMVLVMTSNFLTSNWCGYELEMAISENVQRGFNTIVPIMLEPLDDIGAMPSSLQHIIRSLTYIQWPDSELERPQFWSQLSDALCPH